MNFKVRPLPDWLVTGQNMLDKTHTCVPGLDWVCVSAEFNVIVWLHDTFEFNKDYCCANETYDLLVTPKVFTVLSLKWQ